MRLLKRAMSDTFVGFDWRSGEGVVLEILTKLNSTVAPFILYVAEFELLISAG